MQELMKDRHMKDYFCIILDETHERSVNTDFVLPLLRETVRLRNNFKLVICRYSLVVFRS